MRPYLIHFGILLTVVAQVSCKNKTLDPVVPINREIMVAGDSTFMTVSRLNDTIIFTKGQLERSRDFDFNNDQKTDLTLFFYTYGTPAQQYTTVYAKSRNLSFLHAFFKQDTTFLNKVKSQGFVQDTIPFVSNISTNSCKRTSTSDVIISVSSGESSHCPTVSDGTLVETLSSFSSDSLILFRDYYSQSSSEMKSDSLFITVNNYDFTCDNKPLNTAFYIVCRVTDNGENKLAWLKLNIVQRGKIILYNTAIMK